MNPNVKIALDAIADNQRQLKEGQSHRDWLESLRFNTDDIDRIIQATPKTDRAKAELLALAGQICGGRAPLGVGLLFTPEKHQRDVASFLAAADRYAAVVAEAAISESASMLGLG